MNNNKHWLEYQIQRVYAEEIIRARWLLNFNEWLNIYLEEGYLRDYSPVTSNRYLRRKNHQLPFEVGNVYCSQKQELSAPVESTVYRYYVNSKDYKVWRS